MRVLITGGSGFIGSHLVKELVGHGYEIKILTRQSSLEDSGISIARGDITRPETLLSALEGVDAVFHNAAYAADWGKRKEIYSINVEGTVNVAKACRKKGIERMVFTSSAGVYGFPGTLEEITEDSPKKPLNVYQKSKLDAEAALRKFGDMHISIIRPSLVLGGGAKAAEVMLSKIEQGKMAYIGSGNSRISIAHPEDVAMCLRLALEKDKEGGVYNVLSFISPVKQLFEEIARQLGVEAPKKRVTYSIAYIAAYLEELFAGKEPSLTRFRVKSFGTTRNISYEKAGRALGYEPKFDLQSTVRDMVSWYKTC